MAKEKTTSKVKKTLDFDNFNKKMEKNPWKSGDNFRKRAEKAGVPADKVYEFKYWLQKQKK
jgi:hypothetical protein